MQEEELVEGQPAVRLRIAGLKRRDALGRSVGWNVVQCPQRLGLPGKLVATRDGGRQPVDQAIEEERARLAAEPLYDARRDALDRRIAHTHAAARCVIGLQVRVRHLQVVSMSARDAGREVQSAPRESRGHSSAAKPDEIEPPTRIFERRLEPPPRRAHAYELAAHGRGLAGAKLADRTNAAPILVASRQQRDQVEARTDAAIRQPLGNDRTHATQGSHVILGGRVVSPRCRRRSHRTG